MSSTDKRIVELEFDNKQFESGVSTSLKSLQNLDKSLDSIDGKSLNGLQSAINGLSFNGIEDGVSSLNDKFSAMGTFFRSVIANIAEDVYDLGKKIVSSTFGQILTGGSKRAQNLEHANFMFRGIFKDDPAKVQSAMASANEAVLDTAYGLDEAAVVASQLAASGVELGDDMTKALTAISGAAAMTGGEYIDLGRIFTTVAGNGRLMGQQLLQFSIRGMNVAADIAEVYGMTEAEVRSLVSKGAITFDMFYNTLYTKYAEHAKKANETFSGALSNVKAALNRIGAEIMTPYYEYARDILNAIRPVLNAFKTEMMPVFHFIEGKMSDTARWFTSLTDKLFDQKWNDLKQKSETILAEGPKKALQTIAEILQNSLSTIWNLILTGKNIMGSISKAFTKVFGQDILDRLAGLTKTLSELTKPITNAGKALNKFKRGMQEGGGFGDTEVVDNVSNLQKAFEGLFSVLKSGFQIGGNLLKIFTPLFTKVLLPVGNWFLQVGLAIAGKVGEAFSWFTGLFKDFQSIKVFGTTIGNVLDKVKNAIDGFTEKSVGAINWFFDHFNEIPQWFVQLWEITKDFANSNFPKVIEFFKNLGGTFKMLVDNIAGSDLFNRIVGFFDKVVEKVKGFVKGVTLTDILYAIAGAFVYFKDTLLDLYKFLSPIFEGFFDLMKHFADTVKETIVGSLSDEAGKNLLSGGILATLIIILEKVKTLFGTIDFYTFSKRISQALESVKGILESYQKSIDAQNFWMIAKSIALFAGSIALLALLNTEKVIQVAAVLGALAFGLGAFIRTFSKTSVISTVGDTLKSFASQVGGGIKTFLTDVGRALSQAIRLDSILLALDMFAFAILEMAVALKVISTIEWAQLKNGLVGMTYVLVMIGGIFAYLSILSNRMKGPEIGKLAGAVASFSLLAQSLSVSMLIFSGAMAAFASTYDAHAEGFKAGLIAVITIIATLMIAMKALDSFEASAFRIFSYAVTFTVLAGSVTLLAVGVAALAGAFALIDLLDPGALVKGMGVMIGTLVGLAAAAKIMKGSWASILALSAAIWAITTAMYPLVGALTLLALAPWDGIKKFATVLAISVGVIVAGAIGLSAAATMLAKAGVTLLSFGKTAALFGVAVASFGRGVLWLVEAIALLAISGSKIQQGFVGLAAGIEAFIIRLSESSTAMDAALQNIITRLIDNLMTSIKNSVGPMMVSLGETIVTALDNLITYAPAIVEKLASLFVNIMGQLTRKIPEIVESVVVFFRVLAGEIGKYVGKLDVKSFVMINVIIGELGGLIYWLDSMKSRVPGALKTIGTMAILLGMVVAAFAIMDAIDTKSSYEIAISLSSVLLALSGAMWIVSKVPIAAAAQGAAGLGIFISVLSGFVLGLGLIAGKIGEIEGVMYTLNKGVEVFTLLGDIIGGFIRGIIEGVVGGIMDGVLSSIASLGEQLTLFWINIQPFLDGVKSVDPTAVEGVKNLVETILLLGAAEIISAIANWIAGSQNIADVGTGILAFADIMVLFSEKVSDLTADALTKSYWASVICKNLAEFVSSIPRSGGVWGILAGGRDLKKFGKGVIDFSDVLLDFADKAKELAQKKADADMESAIKLGERFSEFNNAIPVTQTGLWQLIAGKKDMSKFAEGMNDYANILVNFALKAKQMASLEAGDAMESAIQLGERFTKFNNTIPVTQTGLWQLLAGKKDMPKFAKGMEDYANILVNFAQQAKDMAALEANDAIETAIQIGERFAEFNNVIPINTPGLMQLIQGGQDMSVFADGMSNFSMGLQTFYTNLTGVTAEQVDLALLTIANLVEGVSLIDSATVDNITAFSNALNSFAKDPIQNLINTFNGSYQEVRSSVVSLFEGVIKTLSTYEKQFENKGKALVKSLTDGIYNQIHIDSVALTASMRSVGADAIQGFINGGKSMMTSVYWQYWEIGKLALEAAKKALDSHSPSREFEKLGMDSDVGLANGLSQYSYLVEKSSAKVGNIALDAVSDSISKIMSMLDDDLDLTPTITPVLDLSQIQNGVYGVNNLLSGVNSGTFGMIDNNVRGMYETSTTPYNDSNVIAAINGLETRLDNVASRIESMRVVLDNGTLVGEMAPGMDVELGNISTLTRRGVM